MASLRRFRAEDLLEFNNVNLDALTETYNLSFYFTYLIRWPEFFVAAEGRSRLAGYIMGKVEGKSADWHGHVTALSVAPETRRAGVGRRLMDVLEATSDQTHHAYFVDLFVRASNSVAISMYRSFGYSVYRRVVGYYQADSSKGEEEDAFDMRKALSADKLKQSIRENGENHRVRPHQVW